MKFITYALVLVMLQRTSSQTLNATVQSEVNVRQDKFFSLFSIVRFPNSVCTGTNSYNGTCLTSSECSSYGGTASGSCASGFGVCCIVAITSCGKTVQLNNTYWQNSNYPASTTASQQCNLFVEKMSSDICQLRLDFIDFVLAQPDSTSKTTAGQCLTDSFTVSGSSNNVPVICGINNNQHIYVDMTPGTNTFLLNILTTGTTDSRTWNILIRQIPCGTTYTARDHCLQWFTESSGTLTSFNYQYAASPQVQHLANQDYTICIRPNQGFCGIKYEQCKPTTTSAFGISTKADGTTTATTVLDADCNFDFLAIPCASDVANSIVTSVGATTGCASKICGVLFSTDSTAAASTSVYSYSLPFEVRFYTDSSEKVIGATEKEGFGFCLTYALQPCRSTVIG